MKTLSLIIIFLLAGMYNSFAQQNSYDKLINLTDTIIKKKDAIIKKIDSNQGDSDSIDNKYNSTLKTKNSNQITLTKEQLKKCTKINDVFPDLDKEIYEYTFKYLPVKGTETILIVRFSAFESDVISYVNSVRKGDKLLFYNLKYKDKDHKIKSIPKKEITIIVK